MFLKVLLSFFFKQNFTSFEVVSYVFSLLTPHNLLFYAEKCEYVFVLPTKK